MTLQEIEILAGHRNLSPWVIKLVGDAVAAEREAFLAFLMELHEKANGSHNYFHVAANQYRARGQA